MVYSYTNNIAPPNTNNRILSNDFNPNNELNNNSLSTDCIRHQQNELISPIGNQAVLSMGQAQITKNNILKYNTTPEQYISTLIKQGKIPNKNFTVNKSTRPDNKYGYIGISELNKDGKKNKETVFITDTPDNPNYNVGFIKLYNTETNLPYKRISYSDKKDGSYLVEEYDSKTGDDLSSTLYSADGSVQEHENFTTMKTQ